MRQGLYYCKFPDCVIILDPIADRYRLLKGEGADRFIRTIEGKVSQTDQDWLAKQQIDFSNCAIPDPIVAPAASALDTLSGHGNSLVTIQVAWHQLRYQRRLRSHPLHLILDSLAAKRSPRSRPDEQRTWQIAAGSSRAKHFVSARDQCLPRSLAMAHMLFQEGIGAQIVFGVTMPFAAHCWVQQGDVVLNDALDRVLRFRPIMVL